jgi:signal transduction histidine kinase
VNLALAQAVLLDRQIAYAITDRELTVLEVHGALGILGDGYRAAPGHSLSELVPELVGSEDMLRQVIDGVLPRFELTLLNRESRTGETRYLSMVTFPSPGDAGETVGLVHVVEDVTELGALQQRLAQHRNELRLLQGELEDRNQALYAANAELQRLDELKSIFVSVAAHELRTPLTSILGYLEIVLDEDDGALNERQREWLEVVQSSARRLQRITSELLDVTRIEAGRVELVLKPTNLQHVVEAVLGEYEPEMKSKGQELTLEGPAQLPAALCDEGRAAQIVGNLLSNAIKYTPRGGQISVTLSEAEEAGFLKLSVTDTGVGISTQDQRQLFKRFFRAESAVLSRADGAGMGLYITRALVQLHGGQVWVESMPGKGSTFCVTLPVADERVRHTPATLGAPE